MKKGFILKNRIIVILLCLLTVLSSVFLFPVSSVYADEKQSYDDSNVLDDLTGSVIGGKIFDINDYSFDVTKGRPQLLYLSEYCFSYNYDKLSNYALYFYLYNPEGLTFDNNQSNTISIAFGENESYYLFRLKYLNKSVKAGYEGMFYKYKVEFDQLELQIILSKLDSNERIYTVSEFELSNNGNVVNYPVLSTYTYTGYSKGFGSNDSSDSTLKCNVDGFDSYLRVNVHSTYYRPAGTNGKEHTQDSLHSVYFSVDNDLIDEYGGITGATATFIDALLAPALVTGNYNIFQNYSDFLGIDIDNSESRPAYTYIGDQYPCAASVVSGGRAPVISSAFFHYNLLEADRHDCSLCDSYISKANKISSLNNLFYLSESNVLDKENVLAISRQAIENKLNELTELYGDKNVLGRYSEKLFSSVAEEPTLLKIDKEKVNGESLSLTKTTLNSDFWSQLWGFTHTEVFDDIPCLEPVNVDDLSLTDEELSFKYKVALADIEEFRQTITLSSAVDKTVYCLRYRVTDYVSVLSWSSPCDDTIPAPLAGTEIYDGFFFQMSCDLNFQLIDLTFSQDNLETIMPVLMKPLDIFHDGTTPLKSNNVNCQFLNFLPLLLFLVILIILFPIFPPLFNGIIWVITAPFKFINWFINLFKKR